MKKNLKLMQKLLNEACALKGMIAEIACKGRLMRDRIYAGFDVEDTSVCKMQSDLDKYSKRLNKILLELRKYGIPKME